MCDFDFSDLDDLDSAPSKKGSNPHRKTFTCPKCHGTGVWNGGINRHGNGKCWTCGGSGQLVTDPTKLAKQRDQRNARKQARIAEARETNEKQPVFEWVSRNTGWNNFCASLMEQHSNAREWSAKQIAVAESMKAKTEATRAARNANRPKADASRIRKMFADALANGKKRRALHAGHFDTMGELLHKITLTPARAPREEIWVKVDGEFAGGIKADGSLALRNAPQWLTDTLLSISANPDEQCRLYGKRTGSCSCCGRELTNETSIQLGIGPICREKWGLG